jgi:hypothetical protein
VVLHGNPVTSSHQVGKPISSIKWRLVAYFCVGLLAKFNAEPFEDLLSQGGSDQALSVFHQTAQIKRIHLFEIFSNYKKRY